MKLEVGMYVRTKNHNNFPGGIGKIEKIEEDKKRKTLWLTLDVTLDKASFLINLSEVSKASYDTIDLIEENDVILGKDGLIYQVDKVWKYYVFTKTKNKYGQTVTLVDYQIDKILTHEQFEHKAYKVN